MEILIWGVMLPYTPLHQLLMKPFTALVMTSGNLSDEPIISDEEELQKLMDNVIDCALVHDRPIEHKCDDSIVRVIDDTPVILRRARGYVPNPIHLVEEGPAIFAVGAELKSTFCLSKKNKAYVSQYMGDLEEYRAIQNYEKEFQDMKKLLEIEPEIIVHDLHPDYWSTRFALKSEIKTKIGIQHHHAHIASCMVEHGLNEKVIGISFDGTGYGTDGNLWGGEFLIADLQSFQRAGHLAYRPLPGGEKAILEPWRMALSYFYSIYGREVYNLGLPFFNHIPLGQIEVVMQMMEHKINSPLTSGMGRLFDAVYGLLGNGQRITFEGQTGIFLESLVDPDATGRYEYNLCQTDSTLKGVLQVDVNEMMKQIQLDMVAHRSYRAIAAKFHNTIVSFSTEMCEKIKDKFGLEKVVLSGGCFQNAVLTERLIRDLQNSNFVVYTHHHIPPNDGGISLGQLAIAMARINSKETVCV
jgi:hydrogenase maturation protein HypF